MKKLMEDVLKFHDGVGAPRPEKPTTEGRIELRANLINEEFEETLRAISVTRNRDNDLVYNGGPVDLVGLADGLADMIYVIVGTALEFGIPLDKVWAEVHRSNMDKFRDGQIVRRADGKILKPLDWKAPDIEGCLK